MGWLDRLNEIIGKPIDLIGEGLERVPLIGAPFRRADELMEARDRGEISTGDVLKSVPGLTLDMFTRLGGARLGAGALQTGGRALLNRAAAKRLASSVTPGEIAGYIGGTQRLAPRAVKDVARMARAYQAQRPGLPESFVARALPGFIGQGAPGLPSVRAALASQVGGALGTAKARAGSLGAALRPAVGRLGAATTQRAGVAGTGAAAEAGAATARGGRIAALRKGKPYKAAKYGGLAYLLAGAPGFPRGADEAAAPGAAADPDALANAFDLESEDVADVLSIAEAFQLGPAEQLQMLNERREQARQQALMQYYMEMASPYLQRVVAAARQQATILRDLAKAVGADYAPVLTAMADQQEQSAISDAYSGALGGIGRMAAGGGLTQADLLGGGSRGSSAGGGGEAFLQLLAQAS